MPKVINFNSTTTYEDGVLEWQGRGVTVAGGTAVFNLTNDGTATGTAVFTRIFEESLIPVSLSLTRVLLFGAPTVSADLKTITLPVKEAAISSGVLVYNNASINQPVQLTVKGI